MNNEWNRNNALWMLLIIRDAVMWHVVPLIVITAMAEIVRAMAKYSWAGIIVSILITNIYMKKHADIDK